MEVPKRRIMHNVGRSQRQMVIEKKQEGGVLKRKMVGGTVVDV